MCGCMLMHTMMNHGEHQHVPQTGQAPAASMPEQQCKHCGFPLRQGYAFCPGCGMSLETAKCPACGQKVHPDWTACAYCGAALK